LRTCCLSYANEATVLPDWKLPTMNIYALYPSRKHLSPAVRALLDYLAQRWGTVPWGETIFS
jgi:DNA-binding transcriptional LysR family regulator